MSSRQLILAFLFILTVPLFARDKTDRLSMKNGDSMTCEIKGLDGGVLYVSFRYQLTLVVAAFHFYGEAGNQSGH
jgi:hypothetical protein